MRGGVLDRDQAAHHAPRASVYQALLDPAAVARWKVPAGMTCHVYEFDAREGGALRISLTYDAPERSGKTRGRTDTYHGRFVELVPNKLVVEVDEFDTADPALRGEKERGEGVRLRGVGNGTAIRKASASVKSVDDRRRTPRCRVAEPWSASLISRSFVPGADHRWPTSRITTSRALRRWPSKRAPAARIHRHCRRASRSSCAATHTSAPAPAAVS